MLVGILIFLLIMFGWAVGFDHYKRETQRAGVIEGVAAHPTTESFSPAARRLSRRGVDIRDKGGAVATMEVWVLVFWSLAVQPFDAGEYSSRERCVQGAQMQLVYWRKKYGALWWSCDVRHE